jgi:hypothetical protein
MATRFAKRIAAAEGALNLSQAEIVVVNIRGGLIERGDREFAEAGGLVWRREPGESAGDFRQRATAAAIIAHEQTIVFGGLPPQ